jgi:Kef-type K+ transport system membrane component KefB
MGESALPGTVLLIGALVALSILVKAALEQPSLPPLVGYLILGFALRWISRSLMPLGQMGQEVLEVLAKLGVVALLFRVGLESNLRELLGQLRSASFIWVVNVVLSGVAGYLAGQWIGLDATGSILIAVAMTATSVGIPSRIWREAKLLDTPNGRRFLDVAELDDISGVILLGMLLSVLPVLKSGGSVLETATVEAAWFIGKLLIFAIACMLFSLLAEERITRFFRRIESAPDPMLVVAGLGFIIAAVAGLLGFSLAIGAFFAGLAFSRDPERVKLDASFSSLYELFTPFFFIGIGFAIAPGSLAAGLAVGMVLLPVAVAGKIVGTGLPARVCTGWTGALGLGLSMIPRAEITMIIMQAGLEQDVIAPAVYSGMVLVSAVTCVVVPILLRWLMKRHEQGVKQ